MAPLRHRGPPVVQEGGQGPALSTRLHFWCKSWAATGHKRPAAMQSNNIATPTCVPCRRQVKRGCSRRFRERCRSSPRSAGSSRAPSGPTPSSGAATFALTAATTLAPSPARRAGALALQEATTGCAAHQMHQLRSTASCRHESRAWSVAGCFAGASTSRSAQGGAVQLARSAKGHETKDTAGLRFLCTGRCTGSASTTKMHP